MGIHRNDRLYRDLEKAVYPDEARIDRAGRLSRERAATQYEPSRPPTSAATPLAERRPSRPLVPDYPMPHAAMQLAEMP